MWDRLSKLSDADLGVSKIMMEVTVPLERKTGSTVDSKVWAGPGIELGSQGTGTERGTI
jgi:hypothetical protein